MTRSSLYRTSGPLWCVSVVCFVLTCGVPALGQVKPATKPADPQTTDQQPAARKPPADLPKAADLIARHLKSIGGKAALMKHTSRYQKGTFSMPAQQITGDLEVFAAKPNKSLAIINIPQMGGQMRQGFDGKVGWSISPQMGARLAEGEELDRTREQSDFYGDLKDASKYKTVETVDQVDFAGTPCYQVRFVSPSGTEHFEFFDVKTERQTGSTTKVDNPMSGGKVDINTVLSDYKEFDGIFVPTRTTVSVMGMDRIITVDKLEFDKVDAKVFDLPEEVQALMKEKKSGDGQGSPKEKKGGDGL